MKRQGVHELFRETATGFADDIAIERAGSRMSYAELEAGSNNLANFLIDSGCSKGSIVVIVAEETVEVVTAIIATLKAGCVFVPLDPAIPDKRLEALVAEVSPQWLLAESCFLNRLAALPAANGERPRVVRLDREAGQHDDISQVAHLGQYAQYWNPEPPAVTSDPDDMCYIYFTSGSTGKPKGIAGRLKSITHFIEWEKNILSIGRGYRVSQLTSPAFDASLRDIFVPLCAGGTVCAPGSRDAILDPRALIDWIDGSHINLIHCVPSLFRSMLNELSEAAGRDLFLDLRYVLLAGEPLLPSDVKRWRDVIGDRVQLVNLYGPSETTMTKFFYFVKPTDADRRSIPIGKPMEGARAVVVNAKREAAPVGTVGEIYIRTPFRTLGYYNRPELTQEVFVQNPFGSDPNDIVYRTGDLGRVLEDGNFEFLGRQDHQVKIRGVRIEMAEVENLLRAHEAVNDVVVVDREDTSRNKYLCAYVVLNRPEEPGAIKEYLSRHLPDYAVPSAFVVMDTLPRTINGKVDRRALPAPAQSRPARAYVAPRTPVEEELAGIWSKLLGTERVGLHDNFFEMGGHSLLATQLLARVRSTFGVEVPLRTLFNGPTLEALALAITKSLVEQQGDQEIARMMTEISQLPGEALDRVLGDEMRLAKSGETE